MRRIKVKQVDAFTDKPFTGNPAGVVLEAEDLSEKEMQAIAKELNLSQTAFIFQLEREESFLFRFFTPLQEVPLCGHATLSAIHCLLESGKVFLREPLTTLFIATKKGEIPAEIYLKDGIVKKIMIDFGRPEEKTLKIDSFEELKKAIGIKSLNEDYPLLLINVGLDFLIIPIKTLSELLNLKPNFSLLKEICLKIGISSVHLFTLETKSPLALAHARNFSPLLGISEDPVTGTANAALGYYLFKNDIVKGISPLSFIIEQGESVFRPGEVFTEVHFEKKNIKTIKLGGKAVTVMEGEIFLSNKNQ